MYSLTEDHVYCLTEDHEVLVSMVEGGLVAQPTSKYETKHVEALVKVESHGCARIE